MPSEQCFGQCDFVGMLVATLLESDHERRSINPLLKVCHDLAEPLIERL